MSTEEPYIKKVDGLGSNEIGFYKAVESMNDTGHSSHLVIPEVIETPDGYDLRMPQIAGEDLLFFLNKSHSNGQGATKHDVANMITQLGEALDFVHDLSYTHGDLAPRNAIRDHEGRFYLIDFADVKYYRDIYDPEFVKTMIKEKLGLTDMAIGLTYECKGEEMSEEIWRTLKTYYDSLNQVSTDLNRAVLTPKLALESVKELGSLSELGHKVSALV